MLAASLVGAGMNWWQAVGTSCWSNLIVCVPMVLMLMRARDAASRSGARAGIVRRPGLEASP
jgi:cytosine/uracil/thiamine/allantoin permease